MIRVNGLTKKYQTSKRNIVEALSDINVEFPEKGLVCIVGKSGCGKTTLLNCLSSLDEPSEGRVYISAANDAEEVCLTELKGQKLDEFRNLHMGIVFQEFNLINEWTVGDNIQISLDVQEWKEKDKNNSDKRIIETLKFVGLEDLRDRYIKELSGGQQQRVAIARAIVKSPRVLLADEPTGNLDSENSRMIMELLKRYSEKCLVIVVTHDVESAEEFADRIIRMQDGKIVEDNLNISEKADQGEIFEKRENINTKRLSVGNIFHLAFNNLQVKKLKLFFSLLVLVIVVCAGKMSITFVCNDLGKAASEYLVKKEPQFLYTYEKLVGVTKNGFEENVYVKNTNNLEKILVDKFGEENCYSVIHEVFICSDNISDEYECRLVVDGVLNDSYEFYGKLPKEKDEIVITDYMAYLLGLENECIGMKVIVNQLEMTITGIINVGVEEAINNTSFYEGVTFESLYMDGTRLIVSDKYPEYLKEQKYLRLPFSNLGENFGIEGDMSHIVSLSSLGVLEEHSYDLISGRMPENDSEILVSDFYANANLFINDVEEIGENSFGFMDIHNSNQKGVFSGYLSLYEYIPEVKIVGMISGENVPDIIVSDNIFETVRSVYSSDYYTDSFEVLLNDKLRADADIYNDLSDLGIKMEMGEMELLYERMESIEDVKWAYELFLCVVGILLILLLIIFFSFNVKDNHVKIGILKSMGISNGDLMKIWLAEALIVMGLTWMVSSVLNIVYFNWYNNDFKERYGYLSNIIHHNLWTEGAEVLVLFVLTFITVMMPIWIMSDKKPVELIRSR